MPFYNTGISAGRLTPFITPHISPLLTLMIAAVSGALKDRFIDPFMLFGEPFISLSDKTACRQFLLFFSWVFQRKLLTWLRLQ